MNYEKEMENYFQSLAEELGVSLSCALNVFYLRQRSRWTQDLENELIRMDKEEGRQPNMNDEDFPIYDLQLWVGPKGDVAILDWKKTKDGVYEMDFDSMTWEEFIEHVCYDPTGDWPEQWMEVRTSGEKWKDFYVHEFFLSWVHEKTSSHLN